MAFERRFYAGGATSTTLANAMSSTDTSFTIVSDTSWPGSPGNNFFVVIDRDTAAEEKILCEKNSGTTVTIASSGRGQDGTTAASHIKSATVEVCITAQDGDEANQLAYLLGNMAVGSLAVGAGSGFLATELTVGGTGKLLGVSGGTPAWTNLLTPVSKSADYTAVAGDLVLVDASSGVVSVTVPVTAGALTAVVRTDSAGVNGAWVIPAASGTIQGATEFILWGQYAGVLLVGDGTNVWVVGTAESAWTAFTPTWTAVTTNPAIGDGTLTGLFKQNGGSIEFQLQMTAGSTTTFGSGYWSLGGFPDGGPGGISGATNPQDGYGVAVVSYTTYPISGPASGGYVNAVSASSSYAETAAINASIPASWASGDSFTLSGRYQSPSA